MQITTPIDFIVCIEQMVSKGISDYLLFEFFGGYYLQRKFRE